MSSPSWREPPESRDQRQEAILPRNFKNTISCSWGWVNSWLVHSALGLVLLDCLTTNRRLHLLDGHDGLLLEDCKLGV